jgi:uncharacterized lipoprotein YddW (UPF0748 family)
MSIHHRLRTVPALFFRVYLVVLGSILLLFPNKIVLAQSPFRFGLWVESEGKNQPFKTADNFREYLDYTGRYGFTDLYCQVYRGGRSWFPSMVADDDPYRDSLKQGFDPLSDTIRVAHQRGQKVHAWVNVLRAAQNKNAPIIKVAGTESVLTDNHGHSVLDYDDQGGPPGAISHYFQLETPAYWLDPSSEAVRTNLLETFRDLLMRYPTLDGIHMDMIRYSFAMKKLRGGGFGAGLHYSYSQPSMEKFYRFFSRHLDKDGNIEMPTESDWANWRRQQVTEVVTEVRKLAKSINPKIEVSAAVLAWPDRAFQHSFQDWGKWISEGLVDSLILMSYTRSTSTVRQHTKHGLKLAKNGRQILMGLGSWLMLNHPETHNDQIRNARIDGANGVVLFSYSNLLSGKGKALTKVASEQAVRIIK